MEGNKKCTSPQQLPLTLFSRILLYCSPRELLQHRWVNRTFRRVVSMAWQLQIQNLNLSIINYHQAIDAYPTQQSVACKLTYQAYLSLRGKIMNHPNIILTPAQCAVCDEYRRVVLCLASLFGMRDGEVVPENSESVAEFVSIINLMKAEFDPLSTFSKDEIKKGRKSLRALAGNESTYARCNEINDIYHFSCFVANAYRVAKKLALMPMLPLVERKHQLELQYSVLTNIYNQRLAKYNLQ